MAGAGGGGAARRQAARGSSSWFALVQENRAGRGILEKGDGQENRRAWSLGGRRRGLKNFLGGLTTVFFCAV